MQVIDKGKGKRHGERGITVHILKQLSNETTKTITVKNSSIQEVYDKIKFALNNIDAVNDVFIVNRMYVSGGDLYGR